jgi:hypothetical protein
MVGEACLCVNVNDARSFDHLVCQADVLIQDIVDKMP